MPPALRAPPSSDSAEYRGFLQSRLSLFWKVIFFIILSSTALGAFSAVATPGLHLLLTLLSTAQAGALWWLCARGERSVRFLRLADAGGLLIMLFIGALLGRYLLLSFAHDHALVTAEGHVMAEGYVSMGLQQAGTTMMIAIRAALVPSSPRRTLLVTSVVGVPMLLVTALVVPTAQGSLGWRPLDSAAYPWLPGSAVMMWVFAIVTCTVISWVIYGLQVEVREARRLGQYVLERKIGEGGMGEVYQARHGMMRRPTALKLLRGDRVGEQQLRRFEREVQLTARLTHPNTITLFDYGRTPDGVFYYAMELLDGANLERIVAVGGAQSPSRVVRILTMVCGALGEAHGVGLIHRDVKPANIMLCAQGGERDVVKLLDFGLVKELEIQGDVKLTGTRALTGTPLYMAPESIVAPESVDGRSDIYALGAVGYFLLTGHEVFDGKSLVEVCSQHLHQVPAALSTRGVTVPAELEAVVLACLEKEPARRPQSALELRRRLDACGIEAWSSEDAQAWWAAHQRELDDDGSDDESEPALRTVAIDGAPRGASFEPH